MAVSENDTNRIIYEIYGDLVTNAEDKLEKTRVRMKKSGGTIGSELDYDQDRVDWWVKMGRWNPFKANREGNRIDVKEIESPNGDEDSSGYDQISK